MTNDEPPGTSGRDGPAGSRERRFMRHQALVRRMAARLSCPPEWREEICQQGYVGLLKALDAYDPARGAAFTTYAVPVILGEMRHWLRRAWRERRRTTSADAWGEASVPDVHATDLGLERISLREALGHLDPTTAALIRRYFYEGWSQSRLATEMAVSQSAVSRRLRRALHLLRQELTARPPQQIPGGERH